MGSNGVSYFCRLNAQLKCAFYSYWRCAELRLRERSQEKEKYIPCQKMAVILSNTSASFYDRDFFSSGSQKRQISLVILKISLCPILPIIFTSSARINTFFPLSSKTPIKQLKQCGRQPLYSSSYVLLYSRMTLLRRSISRIVGTLYLLRLGTIMNFQAFTQIVIVCRFSYFFDLWYSKRLGSSSISIIILLYTRHYLHQIEHRIRV